MHPLGKSIWRRTSLGLAAAALWGLTGSFTHALASPGDNDAVEIPLASTLDSTFAPDAEGGAEPKAHLDIYGFAMLDTGYDFKQVNPDWFDVLRPTKLPSFPNEFGDNGNWYAGVRQSRLGFKGYMPTSLGEIKTIFEFELFGTGVDAGQTTFRLRHAWGELGQFGAGQTWSPFMDPDVFPNSLEYWGPNGMVFFRNVQVKWMPMRGENELFFALERPGASADQGNYADRIQEQGVRPHFPAPDFSAHYKRSGDWGHVQLAGIVRYIAWTDTVPDQIDLSGHATGWGVNGSTNIKVGKTGTIRAELTYGEGIENYMNDAPSDIGVEANPGNANRPFLGKPLPVFGAVGFYDFNWNECFSTALGYSYLKIDNKDGATPSTFKSGQYALVNLLYYPVKNVMAGVEFQWGRRENFTDGFGVDDYRIQFSAKYNFSFSIGGNK
jgi:hypothetical protein